jgi:quercetin dioxygenase-like cupin family protein
MEFTTFTDINKHVQKGWGYEAWIANGPLYCGKILCLWAGKKLSWHYHNLKDETFFCLDGKAILYYSDDDCMPDGKFDKSLAKQITLVPGMAFHVNIGLRHRVEALETTHLVEVSTEHFDEDSIRLEKGD